jgi:hypothetical protein
MSLKRLFLQPNYKATHKHKQKKIHKNIIHPCTLYLSSKERFVAGWRHWRVTPPDLWGGSGSAEIGGRIYALGLLRQPILLACLGDRQRCSLEISDAAGLEAGDATAVWRSGGAAGLEVRRSTGLEVQRCYRSRGPTI